MRSKLDLVIIFLKMIKKHFLLLKVFINKIKMNYSPFQKKQLFLRIVYSFQKAGKMPLILNSGNSVSIYFET